MIELSKESSAEVMYPLKYVNVDKKLLILSEAPASMPVVMHANGFRLLQLKYLMSLDSLRVDVNRARLRKEGVWLYGFIKSGEVIQQNINRFPVKKVNEAKTDTLYITLESISVRKIKVVADLNLSFAKGFEQSDSFNIRPKVINVKGCLEDINSIQEIKTEYKKIRDIKSDTAFYVKLRPLPSGITAWVDADSVKVFVSVKSIDGSEN